MPFEFTRLAIPDVVLVRPRIVKDDRGFFCETYKLSDFVRGGVLLPFVQDNHAKSGRGVLRGLHYQKNPKAQGKLVRCVKGHVFDVAVDVRRSSPTFGKWVGVELTEDNKRQLWIPPGFAHGFLVLSDFADFLYKTTDYYAPAEERCIAWNDPKLAIEWPLSGEAPGLSQKDSAGMPLNQAEVFA